MKRSPDGVFIAVVEQETGLSKDVLRKWEARYNFPVPERDKNGDRVYSRDQIVRLRTIKRLLDGGHRPSKLFEMDEQDLAKLAASPPSTENSDKGERVVSGLLELLKTHQPAKFRAKLARLLQAQGLRQFVRDTMAPLTAAVGEAWLHGELRVFEEHMFSDIASATLRQALDAIDAPEGRPRILMTTLPGESHSLGLLIAACLFTLQGAHCIYLGTETPAEEIAQAARAHKAEVVAVSFSSAFATRQVQPALLDLRQKTDASIEIVAGGAGIYRQKPLTGIHCMKDLDSIEQYVARFVSA